MSAGSADALSQGFASLGVGALFFLICFSVFRRFVLGKGGKKKEAQAPAVTESASA